MNLSYCIFLSTYTASNSSHTVFHRLCHQQYEFKDTGKGWNILEARDNASYRYRMAVSRQFSRSFEVLSREGGGSAARFRTKETRDERLITWRAIKFFIIEGILHRQRWVTIGRSAAFASLSVSLGV